MNLLFPEPVIAKAPVLQDGAVDLSERNKADRNDLVMASLLGLALVWCYWPTLANMVDRWGHDPQYSHGFLVPAFAVVLLWIRKSGKETRRQGDKETGLQIGATTGMGGSSSCLLVSLSSWLGLALLAIGLLLRLLAARIDFEALDGLTLLPTLAGLVLLVGGWPMLRWSWPAIAFLGFMVPLPFVVEQGLSQPLRRLATITSVYLLETLGYPAVAEGNVILIDEVRLGVAQACSGLGMLMTFFALATALVILVRRPWVDKLAIVAGAIPIAVVVNVLRITATGVARVSWGEQAAHAVMHDLAGWLMPPAALLLMWLELWLIDRLFPYVARPAPLRVATENVP